MGAPEPSGSSPGVQSAISRYTRETLTWISVCMSGPTKIISASSPTHPSRRSFVSEMRTRSRRSSVSEMRTRCCATCGSRIRGADKSQRDCGANNSPGSLSTLQQHPSFFCRCAKNASTQHQRQPPHDTQQPPTPQPPPQPQPKPKPMPQPPQPQPLQPKPIRQPRHPPKPPPHPRKPPPQPRHPPPPPQPRHPPQPRAS